MTSTKIVPLKLPEPDEPTEEEQIDSIDMALAENRAHAIRGALSILDSVPIKSAEFWAVFNDRATGEVASEWLTTALRKLRAIEQENPWV